tara:strand:- start:120 stop:521 length:402 start_codon:yes stop_codon:yes gene_type:complete
MVNSDYVCGLLLIPLFVSCGYTGDNRGPGIVLACTLVHFLVIMMSKPDPLGNAQRKFTELLFATAAGLSIGVLAGGPPEMSISASVLAILADIMCWGEGEKSINAVDTIPLEERGGMKQVGDIVFTKKGPILM